MPTSYLKAKSRNVILQNMPKVFIISLLYVALFTTISSFAVSSLNIVSADELVSRLASGILEINMIFYEFSPIGISIAALLFILTPILDTGFKSYCMKLNNAQETEYKDIFNGLLFIRKVLSIFFVTSFFVIAWSVLLIVPGIVAAYKYRQAYYILLDDPKKSVMQCITESSRLMYGRKLDLFVIDLSFVGWHILNFIILIAMPFQISLPILSIWTSPYIGLTRVKFYEDRIKNLAV